MDDKETKRGVGNDATFGLRHGTLYEADARTLAPWARHVEETGPTPQSYGLFVLVTVPDDDPGRHAGEAWMVDTWDIDRPVSSPLAHDGRGTWSERYVELAAGRRDVQSATIDRWVGRGDYNACVRLEAGNAGLFRKVMDIAEWGVIDADEARDYDGQDVIHGIRLFREQGYDWERGDVGVAMVRR